MSSIRTFGRAVRAIPSIARVFEFRHKVYGGWHRNLGGHERDLIGFGPGKHERSGTGGIDHADLRADESADAQAISIGIESSTRGYHDRCARERA